MTATAEVSLELTLDSYIPCPICKGQVNVRLNDKGHLTANCASCGYFAKDERPKVVVEQKARQT